MANHHLLLDLATTLAQKAGQTLNRYFEAGFRVEHKSTRVDLVTDADRASEAVILEGVQQAFPDHAILAEESGASGAVGAVGGFRWVVDPLDGTVNFAHRVPHFSVLIAVQEREDNGYRTVVAVTLDPLRNELFTAVVGEGAFCNGTPLRVSAIEAVSDGVLATGFAYDRLTREDDNHREFCRLNLMSHGVRRFGSAGLDLAYVAAGRYDGFWERGLQPWDMAGGVLLVAEAGGTVTDYQGAPARCDVGEVVAGNHQVQTQLRDALAEAARHPINARTGLIERRR